MPVITNVSELEALYGLPNDASTVKETDHITADYRAYIEASPFAILATAGPEGLDCSPRGDRPGFVHVADGKTLYMPDRRGNNRADSLRNIVREPRVALLFLVPGSGNTLRVNGGAVVTTDAELCRRFAVDDHAPRSVVVISVEAVFFQCARAIIRADLWNPENHIGKGVLPSPGEILARLSDGHVGGEAYDREWPARARKTMW